MTKPVLVLSGINLFEAGPLSIYYDCLDSLICSGWLDTYHVVAFVHKKNLFAKYFDSGVNFIELPKSRLNYIFRFYYEYFYFHSYSKRNKVDIWLSLHDITPKVIARNLYVYCHNPSPFIKPSFFDFRMGIKNLLFPLLYRYIYKINIKSNTSVIVQEEWIRTEFYKMFKIPSIIVAKPNLSISSYDYNKSYIQKDNIEFIFPAYPRVFKNIQVICEVASLLEKENPNLKVLFILTIDGSENKYSRYLKKKYGTVRYISWLGLQPRNKILELYDRVDYLIFPSKMETWGLPISEFKLTSKPIIVADLPYAHETVGDYDKVAFFDPYNAMSLYNVVKKIIEEDTSIFHGTFCETPKNPFADNWQSLLEIILQNYHRE